MINIKQFFKMLQNIYQKCLQTYHDLIANKKKQDRYLYTALDWTNYFIMWKIKDDLAISIVNSSDVKPKMIELDRKISHQSVMFVSEFFIDRDDLSHHTSA